MSLSEIQSENKKASEYKAFNIKQMFSFLKGGHVKSIETNDLLIHYKKVDERFSHAFGFKRKYQNEIVSIEFWNNQRDQWEPSESLPEFLESALFNKAHEILEKDSL